MTKCILLIEQETNLREVLYVVLTELGGWQVTSVSSIQEGIQSYNKIRPDAVLLDASTSERDAIIFIEELKSYCKVQSIPILLISDSAKWFTEKQLKDMGFAGAIVKPFNPTTIPMQISQFLNW